jgi:hypothetical protein
MNSTTAGWLVDYKAAAWRVGPHAYLSRSWCRMEMFYAANIPLREDNETRMCKFEKGLKHAATHGRRPHLLYGTREDALNR